MSTKTPTRNRISARDAEDMTKIILDDAIEELKKERDAKYPEIGYKGTVDWERLKKELLPNIEIIQYKNEIHIDLGLSEKKTIAWENLETGNRRNACIVIKPTTTRIKMALIKEINAYEANKKTRKKHNEKICELQQQRNNYKDLAARFRLGFTGNPSDINEINCKIKEYLLGQEA